jgi:hypothetical protein
MASFTSKTSGDFNATGQTTWNEVGSPTSSDTVTINTSHAITSSASWACLSLVILGTGSFVASDTGSCGSITNSGSGTLTLGSGTFTGSGGSGGRGVVKGQSIAFGFTTSNFQTGAAYDTDTLPTCILVRNAIDQSTVVTVTHVSTGYYTCSFTIPTTVLPGDTLQIRCSATIAGVPGVGIIWTDVCSADNLSKVKSAVYDSKVFSSVDNSLTLSNGAKQIFTASGMDLVEP